MTVHDKTNSWHVFLISKHDLLFKAYTSSSEWEGEEKQNNKQYKHFELSI